MSLFLKYLQSALHFVWFQNFIFWNQQALPRLTVGEGIVEIMDPSLEGQYSLKEAIQVAAIAAMCVQSEADYRPLMADVVQSLVPLVKHQTINVRKGCQLLQL